MSQNDSAMRSDAKNVQASVGKWQGASSRSSRAIATGMPPRTYEETYTCICCPLGCRLTVMLSQTDAGLDATDVVGYTCRRGKDYAQQEATHPARMVTAAVPVEGRLLPASVKTAAPVPKNSMLQVAETLRGLRLTPPVREGQVLIENVCGTGVDVVATKEVD